MSARWRLAADVVASGGDPPTFLTRLATGETFELNATAATAIQAAIGARPDDAVEAVVRAHPGADADEVGRDVREVVEECVRLGLLVPL